MVGERGLSRDSFLYSETDRPVEVSQSAFIKQTDFPDGVEFVLLSYNKRKVS